MSHANVSEGANFIPSRLASQLASLRKVNEANQPKPPISTPAEFSRLKHERELKLQERQEQYRQQMIAQQRVSHLGLNFVDTVLTNVV